MDTQYVAAEKERPTCEGMIGCRSLGYPSGTACCIQGGVCSLQNVRTVAVYSHRHVRVQLVEFGGETFCLYHISDSKQGCNDGPIRNGFEG